MRCTVRGSERNLGVGCGGDVKGRKEVWRRRDRRQARVQNKWQLG